jgi:flagellar basal body-associated protein FliL
MEPYKMPIRDIIISTLSSKTAADVSNTPGKEEAKEKIKEEINTIMPEDRQILRVNFGDFIIQ